MIAKVHKTSDRRVILAICDTEILGKRFEGGRKCLDLTSDFYKGEDKNEKEILELIKRSNIINAVGKECINLLIKNKIISKENVMEIKKVPYAQVVSC